jgi:hypothetical protein
MNYTTKEEEELMHLLCTMLEQNYIRFNDHYFKQNEGLAMGALASANLAEVFGQYLELT